MMTRTLLGLTAVLLASPAAAQSTTRVSVDSQGLQSDRDCTAPSLSGDGRFAVFTSGSALLVPGDSNRRGDVFLHDRLTGETSLVALNSWGQQSDGLSEDPSVSADGRYVAFTSFATNLVPGDTNNEADVFVRDRQTGRTIRVSVSSAGGQGNWTSLSPSLSADGSCIAFESYASNLVPGDTNLRRDVFVHDLRTGQTSRVNVDSAGIEANGYSDRPAISADGRFVAFDSDADNLVPGDGNHAWDVFVHDRSTGLTRRCSVNAGGLEGDQNSVDPALSSDGRFVAYSSLATNLVPGDTNGDVDVFVHDLHSGNTTRVSVDSAGQQVLSGGFDPALSANGRVVSFASYSDDLTPGDTNGLLDLFVHDLLTGQTIRASVDSSGQSRNGTLYGLHQGGISADGRVVAFGSDASNLVAADTNGMSDIFVHDRGAVGPRLAQAGSCPGPLTLTVSDVSPGGAVALACGAAGTFVKVTQPCLGAVLSIRAPFAGGVLLQADGSGTAALSFHAGAGLCGLSVQAIDVATCQVTPALTL